MHVIDHVQSPFALILPASSPTGKGGEMIKALQVQFVGVLECTLRCQIICGWQSIVFLPPLCVYRRRLGARCRWFRMVPMLTPQRSHWEWLARLRVARSAQYDMRHWAYASAFTVFLPYHPVFLSYSHVCIVTFLYVPACVCVFFFRKPVSWCCNLWNKRKWRYTYTRCTCTCSFKMCTYIHVYACMLTRKVEVCISVRALWCYARHVTCCTQARGLIPTEMNSVAGMMPSTIEVCKFCTLVLVCEGILGVVSMCSALFTM